MKAFFVRNTLLSLGLVALVYSATQASGQGSSVSASTHTSIPIPVPSPAPSELGLGGLLQLDPQERARVEQAERIRREDEEKERVIQKDKALRDAVERERLARIAAMQAHSEKSGKEREEKDINAPGSRDLVRSDPYVSASRESGPRSPQQRTFDITGVSGHIGSFLQHSHAHSHKEYLDEIRAHVASHGGHPDQWKLTGKIPPEKLHVSSHENDRSELEAYAMSSKAMHHGVTGKAFDRSAYQARMQDREQAAVEAFVANPMMLYGPYRLSEGPDYGGGGGYYGGGYGPRDFFQSQWARILIANRFNTSIGVSIDAARFGANQKTTNRFDILVSKLRENGRGILSLENVTTVNNQLRDILRILTSRDVQGVIDTLSLSCDFQAAPDFDMLRRSAKWFTLTHRPQNLMGGGGGANVMPLPVLRAFHDEIVERGNLQNLMGFNGGDPWHISQWIIQQYGPLERERKRMSVEHDEKESKEVATFIRLLSEVDLQALEQERRWARVHAYTHAATHARKIGRNLKTLGPEPKYRPGNFVREDNIVILFNPTAEEMTKLTSQKQNNLKMLRIVYPRQAAHGSEDYNNRAAVMTLLETGVQSGNFPSLLSVEAYNHHIPWDVQQLIRRQAQELPIRDDESDMKREKVQERGEIELKRGGLPLPSVSSSVSAVVAPVHQPSHDGDGGSEGSKMEAVD